MKVAFLMCRLAKYDAIGNFTYDVMKQIAKHHTLSLYAFAVERYTPLIDVNFFTKYHDHNFLEEIKVMIRASDLARELSKNDIIVPIVPQANDILIIPLLSKHINSKLMLVLDFHGITPPHYHKSMRRRLIEFYRLLTAKFLSKRSDFVVVHSNYMQQELLQCFNVKSVSIPIGVDSEKFNVSIDGSVIRKKFQLIDDFVILYVGRLVPHKRVNLLLEALFELKDENSKLLIVGDGSEREMLEKYAKALNLTDKVFFVGHVPDADLPKYYNACDVFATASLHEGVCVPILEALACGKPVIAPNNTAMPETASNGGLIYPGNSLECLIDKIQLLKDDVDLRREIGERALRLASQRNNKRCAEEYRLFLESILQNVA